MIPKLLKAIEDALKEAREKQSKLVDAGEFGGARHAAIVVDHLEDALLRARLVFNMGEPI